MTDPQDAIVPEPSAEELREMVSCETCGDLKVLYWTEAECCMQALPSGECCSEPVPLHCEAPCPDCCHQPTKGKP